MKRLFTMLCLTLMTCITWAQGMPQDGKTYYIYNDNDNPLYFYNNNGALALNGSYQADDLTYLWKVIQAGDAYYIQSASDASCYLAFKKMATSPFAWTIDTAKAYAEGNVTLFGQYDDGRNIYFVIKNTGAFDQAGAPFNKATTDFSSDFCFVEYNQDQTVIPISIQCNLPQAQGTFTLQGKTKTGNCTLYYTMGDAETVLLTGEAGNKAYHFDGFFYNGENLGTEVNVDGLGTNTLEARFSLDIFSQTYGEKWLRFGTPEDVNSAARSSGLNETPMNTKIDVGSQDYLWCFVGDANSFTIYNRALGTDVALTADNAEQGTATYFTAADQAAHWTLLDDYATASSGAGYVITLPGSESQGINCYGGPTGFPLKFWKASGAGTHWNFERIGEGTPVIYNISGDNPFPDTNTRVADIEVSYGNTTASAIVTTEYAGKADTYYLPYGKELSVKLKQAYHGYIFRGITTDENGIINVNAEVDPNNKFQYLFYSNTPEGIPYRIPAIATAHDGTLVAINDYRPCKMDIGYGEVDLMMRRSSDNGQTWSAPEKIADGTGIKGTIDCGFGDAALVADCESDRMLLICVAGSVVYTVSTRSNSNYVCRFYSDDNGATWTPAEDITEQIYGLFDDDPSGQVQGLFFASGRIFQSRIVKKGQYYRLYAALAARPNGNRVVYSDDFGMTWHVLGGVSAHPVPNGDEPKCEELPNGNIVISSRKSYGRYFNIFQFADDTFTDGQWGTVLQSNQQDNGITTGRNACNGEILCVYGKRVDGKYDNVYPIMLQSLPMGDSRTDVTIWWKQLSYNTAYNYTPELFSRNWNQGLQVSHTSSAYSTMCVQPDGKIGFFFEEGPNEYCMVYVPLSLEEITDGMFYLYDPATDGIQDIATEDMANGERLNDKCYDLSGRQMTDANLKKGIYIRQGKKVVVK